MKDFMLDESGDLIVDPDTHDFMMIDGIDEIAQRIKTTLDIRYGEMVNLAPEMGSDYRSFLGKHMNINNAISDISAAVTNAVPEVESLENFKFTKQSDRKMTVEFTAIVKLDDDSPKQEVKEVYNIGQ